MILLIMMMITMMMMMTMAMIDDDGTGDDVTADDDDDDDDDGDDCDDDADGTDCFLAKGKRSLCRCRDGRAQSLPNVKKHDRQRQAHGHGPGFLASAGAAPRASTRTQTPLRSSATATPEARALSSTRQRQCLWQPAGHCFQTMRAGKRAHYKLINFLQTIRARTSSNLAQVIHRCFLSTAKEKERHTRSHHGHADLARLLACRHCCGHGRLLEHGSITETIATSHNVKCLAA